MEGIIIKGIGAYTPSKIVTNDDLSKIVETSDEWIRSRTGIKERRISQGEDTSYMGIKAIEKAIELANLQREDIDLIVFSTCTPDMFIPSSACIVQKEMGLKNAVAFDLNAACSGFVYGIDVARSLMKTNNYKNALVIGSENLSKIINWEDRKTCVLFADGAAAVVLSKSESEGIIDSICKSYGDNGEFLSIGGRDIKNPFMDESISKYQYLDMDGSEIFKFATSSVISSIKDILQKNNMTIDDIDYIVPHQANVRIIEYVAKKLKTSMDKFYMNIDTYGNTSSASIPLALNEMYNKGILQKGQNLLLVGFGGGLTYGSCLIKWSI